MHFFEALYMLHLTIFPNDKDLQTANVVDDITERSLMLILLLQSLNEDEYRLNGTLE